MKTVTFPLLLLLLFAAKGNSQSAPIEALRQHMQHLSALSAQRGGADTWRLDSTHYTAFDGSSWGPASRQYYFYNDDDLLVRDTTITWVADPEVSGFVPSSQNFYTYTPDGQRATLQTVSWSPEVNTWGMDTFRLVNTYDANGRLESTRYFSYSPLLGVWSESARDIPVYDDDGRVQILESFFVFGGNLVQFGLLSYQYDAEGRLVSDLYEVTPDGVGNWEYSYRTSYTFDGDALQERTVEYWGAGAWIPAEKLVNSYHPDGLLTRQEIYSWGDGWSLYMQAELFYSQQQPSATDDPAAPLAAVQMANPFGGGLVQTPALDVDGDYRLILTNMAGVAVYDALVQGNSWYIDAPAQPGIYLLSVVQNNTVKALRKVSVSGS